MGTVVQVTASGNSEAVAREAIGAALAEIERIDAQVSSYREKSPIARLNREGHEHNVPLEKDIFDLLRQAVAVSEQSTGAFDVTIWPVARLWDFEQGGKIPDRSALAGAVRKVGYKGILFDETEHSVGFAGPGMGVDLGAVAKGWAVDRAMGILVSRGIRNAIIDAGGDLRIVGARPGKEFWRIGVQHPREAGTLLLSFDLRDTAIVTSGDYERFFIEGGVRYHHILDPATGMPAAGCRSVTVLAPTAAEADAAATAAFVLGAERGISFLRSRPGVRGLIVDAAGALHWTDEGLERMARR
ncbi:MAG TPA: FAD:protein FMN transferase [Candidatus Methanoperedens sp.]|nr:FAD:protein FMN transferase [Candidatus Methanoperedens sp.]